MVLDLLLKTKIKIDSIQFQRTHQVSQWSHTRRRFAKAAVALAIRDVILFLKPFPDAIKLLRYFRVVTIKGELYVKAPVSDIDTLRL